MMNALEIAIIGLLVIAAAMSMRARIVTSNLKRRRAAGSLQQALWTKSTCISIAAIGGNRRLTNENT
ncbi:MAG: hypothetical protein DI589_10430 [Shinella sp.]|jgi:hypothetical protein|nr:MAG: hypothetical protein DI589_10430 [Shinella sp.]